MSAGKQSGSVHFTLETVQDLVSKEERNVQVLSLKEEPGSGRGDNYTSMLYRMQVKGRKLLKNDEWIDWEKSIIYKILPQSRERREAFKSESLFRNEVIFYNNVWPKLNELQTGSDGGDKRVFGGVAKVYIAKDDLIAMEDLRERGYRMADRTRGLQLDRIKLVLKALAGFHALSLTLKELMPEDFQTLSDPCNPGAVKEALFKLENEDWYRSYYRVAVGNALSMVSQELKSGRMQHRHDEIMQKLRDFLDEDVFFRTMCELAADKGPLDVFCHGDCWTNNFLFKQLSPNVEDVYLVDFQLSRVGSLALDLVYVLYCCTSGKVRRAHMTELLRHYHTHLMSSLRVLNPEGKVRDATLVWQLLNDEMRRCGRFGLGLAVDILPISTCESKEAPDLYEGATESCEMGRSPKAPPRGGVQCSKLMTDIVIELIDNNSL